MNSNKDTTKVLAVKRYLTNSEKNREFLKRGVAPEETFFGVQVVECPKNVVVERKLSKEIELLEKQKKVLVSRINSNQHILKLNFRKFRRGSERELLGDKGEEEFIQPGFAFHHDGTKKSSTDATIHNSVHQLKKDIESIHNLSDRQHYDHHLKHNGSDVSNTTDEETRNEYDREMKVIEKTVKELADEARRVKYKRIEESNKIKKHPYLRAHENDYVWDLPTGSARLLKDQPLGALVMENTGFGFRQSDSGYLTLDRRGELHKARYHTKPQCAACESRVKQQDTVQEKTQSPSSYDSMHTHRFLVGSVNSQSTLFRLPSCILREMLEKYQMSTMQFSYLEMQSPKDPGDQSSSSQMKSPSTIPEQVSPDQKSISPLARAPNPEKTPSPVKPSSPEKTPSPVKTPRPTPQPPRSGRKLNRRRQSTIIAISEVADLPDTDEEGVDVETDVIIRRHSQPISSQEPATPPTRTPAPNLRTQVLKKSAGRRASRVDRGRRDTSSQKRCQTSLGTEKEGHDHEDGRRCISARERFLRRASLESRKSSMKIADFISRIKTDDEKPPVRPAGSNPHQMPRRKQTPFFAPVKTQKKDHLYTPAKIDTNQDLEKLMRELKNCRYLREYKPRKVHWH